MNTAIARRLALGDRVIWMGKHPSPAESGPCHRSDQTTWDDCQPRGLGTIIRITAHQVEVLWEGARARRYRRGQLHNLRHKKLISEAAEFRGTSQYGLERANYLGVSGAAPQANTISIST